MSLVDHIGGSRLINNERSCGAARVAALARNGDLRGADIHVVAVGNGVVGAFLKGLPVELYCYSRGECRASIGLVGGVYDGARKAGRGSRIGGREVIHGGPLGVRLGSNFGACLQANLLAARGSPCPLVHGVGHHSILDADDARRIVGVVRGNREARLPSVQLGLDPLGVGVGPLIGKAAFYVVVVCQAGRAGGIASGCVDLCMSWVRYGHKFVGKTKVEVACVEAVVLSVVVVVPGAVDLVPLAVELNGVPGVAVVGVARLGVGDACGVKQFDIGVGVGLAGARVACESRLGACPGEGVVVLKLVEQPVVQPQGHLILGAVGLSPCLRNSVRDDCRYAGVGVVGHAYIGAGV